MLPSLAGTANGYLCGNTDLLSLTSFLGIQVAIRNSLVPSEPPYISGHDIINFPQMIYALCFCSAIPNRESQQRSQA